MVLQWVCQMKKRKEKAGRDSRKVPDASSGLGRQDCTSVSLNGNPSVPFAPGGRPLSDCFSIRENYCGRFSRSVLGFGLFFL